MIQEIFPHIFHNEYQIRTPDPESRILFYSQKTRSVYLTPAHSFPTFAEIKDIINVKISAASFHYLFSIDETCFFLLLSDDEEIPGLTAESLEIFRTMEPREMGFAGMTGYHLFMWMRDNRFCGRCGSRTVISQKERSLICPVCGNVIYPRISPAVIVAVIHRDKLLMTRYNGRIYKAYALVAGFNEIGETPEDTVRREVMEEVGLRVTDLQYFKSQPWGYSGSLLLGYFAKLDGSEEITLDQNELSEAGWFSAEDIDPKLNTATLTNEMIAMFRDGKIHF